jgi:hypothetical protein
MSRDLFARQWLLAARLPGCLFSAFLSWLVLWPAAALSAPACPPAGSDRDGLLQLRQSGFVVEDDAERNALAQDLLACVPDPDPQLRDGVAFEGLSTWLRGELLSAETYQVLYSGLLLQLQAAPDTAGFRQPFAALILSEVARVDRLQPSLSADQRDLLVSAAAGYLEGVRDYRGFSAADGWRHGVAHGADLCLQLALNEAVDAGQLKVLLDAVATQVAPPGEVFYIYGEPGRLARVVFYAHSRGLVEQGYWQDWFGRVMQASPLADWSEAYSSQQGLAKRHNTLAFLLALHLNATAAGTEAAAQLDGWVLQALQQLP